MLTIALGALGFYVLVRSADYLVDGAAGIGRKFGISDIAIGLVIVAFGTSMPEFAVNMSAALEGNADIALGNVVGSNIANVLFILGVCAIIAPLSVRNHTTFKEVPFALLAAAVIAILALDNLFAPRGAPRVITVGDGLILISFFIIFLYYIASIARTARDVTSEALPSESASEHAPLSRLILYVVGGLAGLALGGTWIVDGAITLAKLIGVSDAVIGLTIVAVGTSLPELASSIAAVRKRKSDIVIGNIIGSNIFNTFWILGVTALAMPITIVDEYIFSLEVNAAAMLLLLVGLLVGTRHMIERWLGALLVLCYVLYIGVLIVREVA